jgi:hypothetical protein
MAIVAASKITEALAKTEINAPKVNVFADGLNNAIQSAGSTAKAITEALAKTEINAPDPKPYAQGLNHAIDVAGKTAKAITKALSKTKIAAPDMSDFERALDSAVKKAKSAAKAIDSALSKGKSAPERAERARPSAEGGIFEAMQGGGIRNASVPTYLYGERGDETLAFIPHNERAYPILDRLNQMFGRSEGGSDRGGEVAAILASLRIPIHIHLKFPMREVIQEVEIAIGQNVRTY